MHPDWIRVRAPGSAQYKATEQVLREHQIVTVCREAVCPNQAECWQNKTATFMIGGDTCTRGCRFCAIATAKRPPPPDPSEPERVAAAARDLGTCFAVITSVDRDDLPDQGAAHWAATISAIKHHIAGVQVEALVPDFGGQTALLDVVLHAGPDVLSHNLETVPSLYSRIRPGARVDWSLGILAHASKRGFITKTGLMLGLGEKLDEVLDLLVQARNAGVRIVTLGQYLRPSAWHAPVVRYLTPEEFINIGQQVRALGIDVVESGPLVRSSYHAHKHAEQIKALAKTKSKSSDDTVVSAQLDC